MADLFFGPPPDMSRPAKGPSFSALQQLQTRTILLRRLPAELVLPILHLASYYAIEVSWRMGGVSVASPNRTQYLVSKAGGRAGRVEAVKMCVRGMDQGFMVRGVFDGGDQRGLEAVEEETTGRKTTSHSYFETYLLRGPEDEVKEVEGSRRVLFENRYAFPLPLTHIATFARPSSPTSSSAADLLALAQPGDRFAIDVVADRSWWVNIVESARIEHSISYFHPPSPRLLSDLGDAAGEGK